MKYNKRRRGNENGRKDAFTSNKAAGNQLRSFGWNARRGAVLLWRKNVTMLGDEQYYIGRWRWLTRRVVGLVRDTAERAVNE